MRALLWMPFLTQFLPSKRARDCFSFTFFRIFSRRHSLWNECCLLLIIKWESRMLLLRFGSFNIIILLCVPSCSRLCPFDVYNLLGHGIVFDFTALLLHIFVRCNKMALNPLYCLHWDVSWLLFSLFRWKNSIKMGGEEEGSRKATYRVYLRNYHF